MHCTTCRRMIWPWQHFGFRVTADGHIARTHVHCSPFERRA